MPRPKRTRQVGCRPRSDYFKPRGIPLRRLSEVGLALEELDALRLAELEGFNQVGGAEQMGVSRATFARVLHEARRKVADALVHGKALRIEGGTFELSGHEVGCGCCGGNWVEPFGSEHRCECPECGAAELHRVDPDDGDDLTPERNAQKPGHGRGKGRKGT